MTGRLSIGLVLALFVSAQGVGHADDRPTGSIAEFRITIGDKIYFPAGMLRLDAGSTAFLDKQITWLIANSGYAVTLIGHCDDGEGTGEYALALGERRARAVKDYMVARGLAEKRIATISAGKERPADQGTSAEARANNRRVEFNIEASPR